MLRLVNAVAQLRVRGARLDQLLEGRYPRLGRQRGVGVAYAVKGCRVAVRRFGQATITGPTVEDVEGAVEELIELVKQAEPRAEAMWRTVNLIYEAELGRGVRLDRLGDAVKWWLKVTFNPDRFPGLQVRLRCGVTANIFSNGRVVLLGCRDEGHAKQGLEELRELVERYG